MTPFDKDRWERLSVLLDVALQLEPEARAAWLETQRARDPALAAEVEALLAREPALEREGFLDPTRRPDLPVEPSSLAGTTLGAYTLDRPVGQGGMGTVWLAHRTDGRFEGSAAIKFLSLAVAGPAGEARFRREGSALARLGHPNIARLLDAGVSPTGQPYLVLEYVDGRPLDVWCDAHQLSVEARITLFRQVLDAVAHAHAHLIVHRDLKPSNILVTADGTVKLLDFGIAKLLDADRSGVQGALTADGGGVLTPHFAAPEQVRGDPATTATDVYALGVLLYLLVSGKHPTGEGCRTAPDAIRALFEVAPARLGVGDLDTVLGKALRKNPAERYQTVAALGYDLTRFLRHEPVSARPDALLYRARKFAHRHRVAVGIAAITAVALAGTTLLAVRQSLAARRERDAAVTARARADAQVEFQTLLMSQLGDHPLTMRELLDRGRTMLERQYAQNPRFLAEELVVLSSRYGELGDSRTRGVILARAESLADSVRDPALIANARCAAADNLRSEGRYDEAHDTFATVDALLDSVHDDDVEADCLAYRADFENELGDPKQAEPDIRRAMAARERTHHTDNIEYAGLLGTLAYTLDGEGHSREATAEYARAERVMDSAGGGAMMSRAILQHDRALVLGELGENVEATRLLHDVLARLRAADSSGPLPVQPLIHYARAALFAGLADSARRYFAVLAEQAVAAHNDYWEGRALFGLAEAELAVGDLSAARRTMARFLPLSGNPQLRSSDDEIVDYRMLEALLARAVGDTATARARVVAMLRANGYFEGHRRPVMRAGLILAAETSPPDQALGFAAAALQLARRDSLTETRSAYVGEARLVEAKALLAEADTGRARADLARAVVALVHGAGPDHPRAREARALLHSLAR